MAKHIHNYKTYIDDDGEEVEFIVFVIHGRSDVWHKVDRFIKDELGFNTIVLKETYTGQVVFDKFRDAVWDANCAIAVMSPDDKIDNENYRARQNVLYELGYCQGVFDSLEDDDDDDYEESEYESVIVLKENSIDFSEVSDLLGLDVLHYSGDSIESTFHKLSVALNNLYGEFKGDDD